MESLLKKVLKLIEKEIGRSISEIDIYKNIREELNLDLIKFVSVIEKIEDVFKVRFRVSVIRVNTLKDFLDFLNVELKKQGKKLI